MGKRRKVANLLAVGVLSYLNERPMHPYELGQTLRQRDDARSFKYNLGSLYTVVRQLEAVQFIRVVATTRDSNRPERTVYAITPAGKAELNDWMSELLAEPQHEYPRFVAALSLMAGLRPEVVVDLLRNRLGRLHHERDEVATNIARTVAGGQHPIFLVEEDFRRVLLEAEISFVERLIDDITDPDHGWAPAWAEALSASEGQSTRSDSATEQKPRTPTGRRRERERE